MSGASVQLVDTPIADADLPHGWIAAEELGLSDRHTRRLFDSLSKLGAAKRVGKVRLFDAAHPEVTKRQAKADRDRSYEDLSPYTQAQVDGARRWVRIIRAAMGEVAKFMAQRRCNRATAVEWFCKQRCAELGFGVISVGTFRRRLKRYESAGDYKLVSQIDQRGGKPNDPEACTPDAWRYFLGLYLDPRKRRVTLCHELTCEHAASEGWSWPSLRTVQRWARERIPENARVLAREGERAFKAKCLPRVERSYADTAAGDIWCADENTMDLYARAPDGRGGWKRVRPKLTAILDVRSRVFVGWHIAARANSDTIVAAFKLGVAEFGPPLTMICDNGSDYKSAAGRSRKWASFDSKRLMNLYGELGCTVQWATPYEPQAKMIESHFRAVCDRFCKLFDSYCGNKPENRPEGAERIPVWELPTVAEVAGQFETWLVAHHAKPQTGDSMFGLSPAQAMEQFRGKSVRQRPTAELLDFLCAKIVGPVKVTRNGVVWQGVRYGQGCEKLYPLLGREVLLRVQPDRADYVDVCDLDGRPIARATNDRLTGATQEDIRVAASRRKKARKAAREFIADAPATLRHSTVTGIIAAQRKRNESEQNPTPEPDPPASVRVVRPDLGEAVSALPREDDSTAGRTAAKRRSSAADLAAMNEALGLGGALDDEATEPEADGNIDALLTSGVMDDTDTMDDSPDDDGPPSGDAFAALGKSIHDRRRA
jgi:putative transposase